MLSIAYLALWFALAIYVIILFRDERWIHRAAFIGTLAAEVVLTVTLIQRAIRAGHWPLVNRYEFALSLVWTIIALYLLLEVSWRSEPRRSPDETVILDKESTSHALSFSGPFVLLVVVLIATYAITRPADQQAVTPLLPALRSTWLQVHVLTALLGYGAFAVAAGLAMLQWGCWLTREGVVERWPTRERIERGMLRAVALGFPWLTFSIFTGAIWAQQAWGRYWDWDPKESWALVTWLWYLMVLHLRPLRRWHGRRLATLVILGFALVLFTFVGVPWLVRVVRLETLHGY